MDKFMKSAIEEAKKGQEEGGIPIGSVLVKGGRIGNYKDTVLYSTLMPCYLCAGAVVQFGIKKVVVGESRNFGGALQFMRQHGVEIIDLDDDECYEMMQDFIRRNPELWDEDIGK